jgi:hypothetical protein
MAGCDGTDEWERMAIAVDAVLFSCGNNWRLRGERGEVFADYEIGHSSGRLGRMHITRKTL